MSILSSHFFLQRLNGRLANNPAFIEGNYNFSSVLPFVSLGKRKKSSIFVSGFIIKNNYL